MKTVSPLAAVALAVAAALVSCGPEPPEAEPPPAPPARTAVADRELRGLLVAVAAHRLCAELEGRLLPLPAPNSPRGPAAGSAPTVGRLRVEGCRAEVLEGPRLALRLSGRGWSWVDELGGGPLATTFAVRGVLRFALEAELTAELDLAYDPDGGLVTAWLTPTAPPRASLRPIGPLPVSPEGGWSSLLGRLGEVLGGSIAERAAPLFARFGAALFESRLGAGATATFDLCTGQRDVVLGPLARGERPARPVPGGGRPWLENLAVSLRPGGLDLMGPFERAGSRLEVDLEVAAGPGLEVLALCEEQAGRVLEAFLASRPAAPVEARAGGVVEGPGRLALRAERADCDLVLVLTPRAGPEAETLATVRVRDEGAGPAALVDCGELRGRPAASGAAP